MVDNRGERKDTIMFSAVKLFSKKGFAGTSMADIANEAGIGKGTTYEYFKGKDELFFETFEYFVKYCEEAAHLSLDSLASKSAEEKIRLFSLSILDTLKESMEFYPLVLEFWAASASSKYREKIKGIFRDFYNKLGNILIRIIEQGEENNEFSLEVGADSVVPGIIGAWDALGLQAWFYAESGEKFDLDKAMNSFTDLIIKGLLNKK